MHNDVVVEHVDLLQKHCQFALCLKQSGFVQDYVALLTLFHMWVQLHRLVIEQLLCVSANFQVFLL